MASSIIIYVKTPTFLYTVHDHHCLNDLFDYNSPHPQSHHVYLGPKTTDLAYPSYVYVYICNGIKEERRRKGRYSFEC